MKTPYRFAIKKDSSSFYGIGDDNNVIISTVPYYFEGDETGDHDGAIANWAEIGVNDTRDGNMSGFFRNYGNDYQFIGNAAKVIKFIYYKGGVSAPAILLLQRLNTSTGEYEIDGLTNLDLSEFQDERDQVTVPAMQADIQELIKANEDVEYEIPFSVTQAITTKIKSFRIKGRAQYLTFHQNVAGGSETQGNQAGGVFAWPSIQQYAEEYTELNDSSNTRVVDYSAEVPVRDFIRGQQILRSTTGLFASTSGAFQNFMFRTNVALENVRITLSLPSFVKNNSASSLTVSARIFTYEEAVPNSETSIATFSSLTLGNGAQSTHTFNIDHTFNVPAGFRVYIMLVANHSDWEWNWERDHRVNIVFDYFTSEFSVKGLPLFYVFQQLISKVTNGQATAQSNLLTQTISYAAGIDCQPDKILMLSGSSIKGISTAKLKISLQKYLKTLDVILCASMGLEGSICRLEKRSHFFQENKSGTSVDNKISDLTDIAPPRFEHADDMMFSELHIGYKQDLEDDLNGKEEFNTTAKYTTSYKKVGNVKDMISPASASGLEIYRTYLKYITDTNKDTKGDDNLFLLQYKGILVSGSYYALYANDMSTAPMVLGLTDPNNMVNIGLSPAHCIARGAYWYYSHFYDSDFFTNVYRLTYQTQEKNTEFKCKITTPIVMAPAGNIDLQQHITSFGMARIFYPIKILSDTTGVQNYRILWQNNRYGYFRQYVEYKKAYIKGFPLESTERNAAKNKEQTFTQLLTASNNLNDLIK